MKKLLIVLLMIVAALTQASATVPSNLGNESLNYKVMYKWGAINKQAGTANLSLRNSGSQYITRLTARSDPWADKFFTVRDTLSGVVNKAGFKPVRYENCAHEGSDSKHDIVVFDHSGGSTVKAKCSHRKTNKKGATVRAQDLTLTAQGVALDMLSMYYYMRYIDYGRMQKGQKTHLYIFSGRRKELLTITFVGYENIEYDKRKFNCFKIKFTFTSDGGKKTSDDMTAWITTDPRHIPVKLEGKLKVGAVHCLYTGG